MPVSDRDRVRLQERIEELLICLVGEPVPTIVGKDNDGPGSHMLRAAGTAAALKECGRSLRCLVLENGADLRIVEAQLEGCSCDNDVCMGIHPAALGTDQFDRQRTVEVRVDCL